MIPTIHEWHDIAEDYRHGLVLGNGASIAFDPRFTYPSLRGAAEARGLITSDVETVFQQLQTSDFELVLRVLWHAQRVNQAFGIREDRTAAAYASVKAALIEVVRAIYPTFSEVEERLPVAAEFMGRFETVISLNYDLLAYWAMQVGNLTTPHRFKDCWVRGEFRQDWEWLRTPFGKNAGATLVFYPHGNIVIGADLGGSEQKVQAEQLSTLLATITAEWDHGLITPVFVSEGTSQQKRSSIRRSPYLSTVIEEVLPAVGPTVVFHGSSFGDEDDHLLDALCRQQRAQRFAVSANPNSSDVARYCGRVESKLESRLGRDGFELIFYNRTGRGCWIS